MFVLCPYVKSIVVNSIKGSQACRFSLKPKFHSSFSSQVVNQYHLLFSLKPRKFWASGIA